MSMIKKPGHFFHQLLKRIVRELLKVGTLRFAALFVLVAALLSMAIVMTIDFLWDGRLNAELEFAGVVTPLLDSLFLAVFLIAMFGEIREETAQRKRMENELRESERRFSDLLGNVELISMMLDREARITYCNEYLLRLTGWKRDEIIGRNWFDIFVPPELNYIKASFFDALLANLPEAHHHENEILTRSGERRLIHWNNSVLRSAEGDVIGTASIGEDVTSHRRAMVELEFTNTILHTQQEVSPDAILVVDENAHIISFNQQFIDMWSLSPQVVNARLDTPVLQAVVEQVEDAETFVARVQYLYEHRDEKSSEEIELKDGRVIDRYSAPVNGANGKYYGRVWYFRDITERKRAEKTLRASRENLHRLLNSMAEGAYGVDHNGDCTFINRSALQMLGYQNENELLGQHIHELIHHSHADGSPYAESECNVYRAYRNNQSSHVSDEVFWRKDGIAIPVEFWVQPIVSDGMVTGAIVTFTDITERKRAEGALRVSEERFRTMFARAPLGIALIDSLTGHIYEVNPRFAEIAGRSMEEMANIDWLKITHPDDVQADLKKMTLLNAGKINRFQMEKRYLHPDGTAVWISMTVAPLQTDDKAHPRHLCMIQDITERKQAEASLVEQLEELRRWHEVTSGREGRILDLKHEVNELLSQAGQPPRYPSAESQDLIEE